MVELKPCPFCGRIDTLGTDSYKDSGRLWYFVKCEECICDGPVCCGEKEAIEAWNGRAE